MEKTCAKHGSYSDLMAMDADFLRRIERLYPGRDFRIAPDALHDHGSSSIKYGRGAVLTVDLTNRCNMMCDPCFMDANQVGYVHELSFDDVRKILDDAITIKPRRQLTVQFSGGEPTLSPHFLESVAYAREVGYFSVQCATNGVRFAQDAGFAHRAKAAGLRLAYLQFDGIGNEKNAHRAVSNLFDVKLKAIENLHAAGVDVTLVVTVVNSINNDQIGSIIRFAIENIDKINAVSFQPVSFTGRDEHLDAETRAKWRYTLSHLAHDVKAQTGVTEPLRDWYPLSASGPLSDFTDQLRGPESQWGSLKCGCHPNCGIGTLFLVNQRTREAVPISELLDTDQILEDFKTINDRHRPKAVMAAQAMLSLVRNFRYAKAPRGLSFWRVLKVADGHTGKHHGADQGRAPRVARAPRRRHVVPGSLQLRLPPDGDVHHPVRDADGRDLVLRLQHGRGLAEDRREDAHERDDDRVVQDEGPPQDLRRQQGRSARRARARGDNPAHQRGGRASAGVDRLRKRVRLPLTVVPFAEGPNP